MAADLANFYKIGKDLGFEGVNLQNFVKEQQDKEAEKLTAQAERVQHESALQKEILQLKIKEEEVKKENLQKETEILTLRSNTTQQPRETSTLPKPRMPNLHMFNPSNEKIEAYLKLFDRWFAMMRYGEENKCIILASHLNGDALETYQRLSEEESQNYDVLKEALLKRYDITPEKCRLDFRNIKLKDDENFDQLKIRMSALLDRWLEAEKKDKTFENLQEIMIKDNLMRCFPPEIRMFIKEKGLKTSTEYVEAATSFMEAHKTRKVSQGQTLQLANKHLQHKSNFQTQGQKPPQSLNPKPFYNQNQTFQPRGESQRDTQKYCYTCKANHDHKFCVHAQRRKAESSSYIHPKK